MLAHDRFGAGTLAVDQGIEHGMVLHVGEVEAPVFTGRSWRSTASAVTEANGRWSLRASATVMAGLWLASMIT